MPQKGATRLNRMGMSFLVSTALWLALPLTAHGGLTGFCGSTVQLWARVSGLPGCGEVRSSRIEATVGAQVEFESDAVAGVRFQHDPQCLQRYDFSAVGFAVDVDDGQLHISFQNLPAGQFGAAAFNGFQLRVISRDSPRVTAVRLKSANMPGRPAVQLAGRGEVGFDLNLSGIQYNRSSRLTAEIDFAASPAAPLSVNEPLRLVAGSAIEAGLSAAYQPPTPYELLLLALADSLEGPSRRRAEAMVEEAINAPPGRYALVKMEVDSGRYGERFIRTLGEEVITQAVVSAFPTGALVSRLPWKLSHVDFFADQFAATLAREAVVTPIIQQVTVLGRAQRQRALYAAVDAVANDVYQGLCTRR